MGLYSCKIQFIDKLPTLLEIQTSLENRTGLTCQIKTFPGRPGGIICCKNFPAETEIDFNDLQVELTQGLSQSKYFLDELEKTIIELAGRGSSATSPFRWNQRKFTERFFDQHPMLYGLILIASGVPIAIYRRFRKTS